MNGETSVKSCRWASTVAVPLLMSQNGREATTARAGPAGEDSGSRVSPAATAPASTTASQARPATHPPPHSPFIARRRRGRPALARSGAGPAPARSGSPGTAPGGGTRAGPPGCRVWLRMVVTPPSHVDGRGDELVLDDRANDVVERAGGLEPDQASGQGAVRHPALHVLVAVPVGLQVGAAGDAGPGPGRRDDPLREP